MGKRKKQKTMIHSPLASYTGINWSPMILGLVVEIEIVMPWQNRVQWLFLWFFLHLVNNSRNISVNLNKYQQPLISLLYLIHFELAGIVLVGLYVKCSWKI
jgi:hypothetical protein